MPITAEHLRSIISLVRYDDTKMHAITDSLNDTFGMYSIDSNIMMCHFLAQVLHESGAFRSAILIADCNFNDGSFNMI